MTETEKFAKIISDSENIAFFGGAGVSTESGLKDYRSRDGIYNTAVNYGLPPEEILSHGCVLGNPELFYRFFRDYFITDTKPGFTHKALAELEQMGKNVAVITQNIDGLHQRAGSRRVYELHGTASKFYCVNCGEEYDLDYVRNSSQNVPKCEKCSGLVRPRVTMYGEMLDGKVVDAAIRAIANADVLIIGGTSLAVQPAASFVGYFGGEHTIIINKEETPYDSRAELVFHESIGDVFRRVMKILREKSEENP
ncbi:MAG: NAD-dependent protein deacylase [Oscillospiraceae bacterium]|nr:NAD-dependent protein deacylase [Oscillospiraceae bacterium]